MTPVKYASPAKKKVTANTKAPRFSARSSFGIFSSEVVVDGNLLLWTTTSKLSLTQTYNGTHYNFYINFTNAIYAIEI